MEINRFGMIGKVSALAGLAVAAAIAAAPSAVASTIEPTPVTPDPGTHASQKTALPGGGPGAVALPPGGPVAVLPGDSPIGGADPYLPAGTDPLVPYGVWSQAG
jgi:hypothetical protein